MARAPFQVLVFPYRLTPAGSCEYAIFFRRSPRYGGFWQGIAGGGEDEETPLQAAKRESWEEGKLSPETPFLQLDSTATIPALQAAGMLWGPDVLVIPEYAFGADAQGQEIVLSSEHLEFRWVDYETAQSLLKFDSNRNALWELDYRLTRESKEI
ncbi:MAG: NUDIX pyrophosphatase [Anaerolineales bacterium]|nr:NUDIX pyrophosphatase [Anaerolineales bacterium]